jgi:hypothetical protein
VSGAQARLLADGRRLHLQHGPIDIIAAADGPADEVARAYQQAAARFATLLDELVAELALLRQPVEAAAGRVRGPVARRMVEATWPHRAVFITPMAAVAGAGAEAMLAAMIEGRRLARAYVNNGGDIALHLAPGAALTIGVVGNQDRPALDRRLALRHDQPARGLATSGWRGRSFSLGIADAVTVLAAGAAEADAAATLIGNAVDAVHPAIEKRPANALQDDTDLDDRLVTVAVGPLPAAVAAAALDRGAATAAALRAAGLIQAALLLLQGQERVVGPLPRAAASARAEAPA